MTSKNLSINYQKLERTQRLWAFWLLLYLAAMSVLSFTFEMFSLSDYHAVTSDLIGVPDVRSFCFTVFSTVFCGIHGFLYLHSRKKADFFLSLPLSRKQLFFASYWNGILFYLIPFAAYKLISFVIADVSGQILNRNTALFHLSCSLLLSFLGFLLLYHTVILGMLLCGKLAVSLLSILLLFFYGTYAVIFPVELYCRMFFQTFYRSELLLTFKDNASPFCLYQSLVRTATDGSWQLSSHLAQMVLLLSLCVCSLVLDVYLFQKRSAESIESTLAFPTYAKYIRPLLAVPAALYCGFFLQKSAPDPASYVWLFVGIAFGAVTAHSLFQISFLGNVRSFLQNKRALLFSLSLSAAIACIFIFDLFSYDSFLPSRKNVASMAVSIDGVDTNDTYAAPPEAALQEMHLQGDSLNTAYTWCQSLSASERIAETSYTSAVILYRTTSGQNIYRRYPITNPDVLLAFDPVYTSDKYKKGMFPLLSGIGHTAKRNLIWSDGISHYVLDLNTEEKEELLSIYSGEMISLSLSTLQTEFPCGSLTLAYPRTDTGDGGLIYPSFHRTINYLKAHQLPVQNTIENYMLVSAERFRILENGYRASEALYESEEDLTKLASQLVVRDFAVNPLLYPVNPSCEILLKTKDPSSGSILEADCALRK